MSAVIEEEQSGQRQAVAHIVGKLDPKVEARRAPVALVVEALSEKDDCDDAQGCDDVHKLQRHALAPHDVSAIDYKPPRAKAAGAHETGAIDLLPVQLCLHLPRAPHIGKQEAREVVDNPCLIPAAIISLSKESEQEKLEMARILQVSAGEVNSKHVIGGAKTLQRAAHHCRTVSNHMLSSGRTRTQKDMTPVTGTMNTILRMNLCRRRKFISAYLGLVPGSSGELPTSLYEGRTQGYLVSRFCVILQVHYHLPCQRIKN